MTTTQEPTLGLYLLNRIAIKEGPLESRCWIWQADRCHYAGRRKSAQVASYETFIGPVPIGEGAYLKSRCYDKRCINPQHLILDDQLNTTTENVKSSNKLLERLVKFHGRRAKC